MGAHEANRTASRERTDGVTIERLARGCCVPRHWQCSIRARYVRMDSGASERTELTTGRGGRTTLPLEGHVGTQARLPRERRHTYWNDARLERRRCARCAPSRARCQGPKVTAV